MAPPAPIRPATASLRQLRAFVAVAREGSITRAAVRLHLTPSALSMLVSGLESDTGVQLFERTSRRLVPTEAAEALLPRIEAVLAGLDEAFRELRDWVDGRGERLFVAASPLLAAAWLPGRLRAFRARQPSVRTALHDLAVTQIASAVADGEVDVGVCTADDSITDLVATPLHRDRLMVACPADHPFARQADVGWASVAGEPLALLPQGSGLRRLADQGFAAHGGTPSPAWEVANVGTAIGLVEAGLALAIVPRHALLHARGQGVVGVPLTGPVLEREIVALTSPRRPRTEALATFVAMLREPLDDGTFGSAEGSFTNSRLANGRTRAAMDAPPPAPTPCDSRSTSTDGSKTTGTASSRRSATSRSGRTGT